MSDARRRTWCRRLRDRPRDRPRSGVGLVGTVRARNDPAQYDDLAAEWWRPDGAFAALHWLAAARGRLVPVPECDTSVLVDLGCGGGLMASFTDGYVHVGVDVTHSALLQARAAGTRVVRCDVTALPLASASASVVVAGEILEHVEPVEDVVREACRVLRPGGTVVIDTISDTFVARLLLVRFAERLPGGPPRRIHDPRLFVAADRLTELFAAHGVSLVTSGLRPSVRDYVRFLFDRTRPVRMIPTPSTSMLYQGVGTKRST